MDKRVALITGITGQDGSYLAELLLEKDYQVHGIVRRVALEDPDTRLWRIRHILDRIEVHSGSLESFASLHRVMRQVQPDECYHLAAQSFVNYSFEDEFSTLNANINGTYYILASIHDLRPRCRSISRARARCSAGYPSPSERGHKVPPAFGVRHLEGGRLRADEELREAYGLHASSGILYNHESPRRGQEFVTRKITSRAAKIKLGLADSLPLGNLEARRDWGHAREYVKAMWLMLQQPVPGDYVIATGETYSVREFAEMAFNMLGLDYREYVTIDRHLFRPAEVDVLQGTLPVRGRSWLGLQPHLRGPGAGNGRSGPQTPQPRSVPERGVGRESQVC